MRSSLLNQGVYLDRSTDNIKLNQFLTAVKPVRTNHELIRMGGDGDGGYLVPNDLEGIDVCFSPGVSEIANFELDLTKRNIKCFLADYSVDAPPIKNTLFDFEKKFLGAAEDNIFMTLENWVNRKAPDQADLLLQMDIEGAEYAVIFDTPRATLKRFRILVIEFHGLEALCSKSGFEHLNLCFMKLLKDFDVVHIHPNNCFPPVIYGEFYIPPVLEFTFLRKDRISERQLYSNFPNQLDRTTAINEEDYALPRCWYS